MAHALIIPEAIGATNIDYLTRPAKGTVDIDNGNVFQLVSKSAVSGEGEVWLATAPATSFLNGLWMAYEPEIVTVLAKYRGINPNPVDFYNPLGKVFTAYKPQVGEIITLTTDAITGTKGSNTFINSVNAAYTLAWGATQTTSALSYRLIGTTYVSIPDGTLGSLGHTTAYQFECVGN